MTRYALWCAATVALLLASPSDAADPAAGRQKAQMCAACHGLDGIAKLPDMPTIAGSAASYLTRQLQAYKTSERQHEQMSIIAQGLSDEDIGDLVAWYSSIEVSAEMPR